MPLSVQNHIFYVDTAYFLEIFITLRVLRAIFRDSRWSLFRDIAINAEHEFIALDILSEKAESV